MGGLFHTKVVAHHPQWHHNPVGIIKLVLWVVIKLVLMMVMVKVVWVLGQPNLPTRRLIFELLEVILCHLGVGIIHSWVIHTNTGTIINHILVGRIIILLLVMEEMVLVLGSSKYPTRYLCNTLVVNTSYYL